MEIFCYSLRVPDSSLLILIPAYNEERRIDPVLRDYARFFQEHYRGKFQIVVLLNGCTDNTPAVVRRVTAEFPAVRALEFHEAIGKGGALIEGLKLAGHADLIGYVDADGATAPNAFLDLVKKIGAADCVIGSRWLPGAVIHQSQTGNRQFASRVFHFIVQFLLRMGIRDTQCGAKVMRSEAVEKIHAHMLAQLPIDRVEVCFHAGKIANECDCRKPKPGMLLRAARELNIDLPQSWMVGDRWRDVDCGHAAGCKTIFIDCGYAEELKQRPDFTAKNLVEAAEIILAAK